VALIMETPLQKNNDKIDEFIILADKVKECNQLTADKMEKRIRNDMDNMKNSIDNNFNLLKGALEK
jgi:hypothetical protein